MLTYECVCESANASKYDEYPQLRALQNLIKLLNLLTSTDEGNLSRRNW